MYRRSRKEADLIIGAMYGAAVNTNEKYEPHAGMSHYYLTTENSHKRCFFTDGYEVVRFSKFIQKHEFKTVGQAFWNFKYGNQEERA